VFAWLAAAAMTLPGVVRAVLPRVVRALLPGVVRALPTVVRYSDQLSRCSYDRTESHGALSLIFCGGFIVPCLVICYCYGMIWRRAREVGRRVDGHNAYRPMKARNQQQQNGESAVFTGHCPPSVAAADHSNPVEIAEPPPSADDNRQPAAENESIVDVRRPSRSDQSSDRDRRTDCLMDGTAGGCEDGVMCVVREVAVDHPRVMMLSVDVTERSASAGQLINTTTCPDCSSCQLTTSSSPNRSSQHLKTSNSHAVEGKTGSSHDHATNVNNVRPSSNDVEQTKEHIETRKHDSITVVVTPAAATRSAAAAVPRDSPSDGAVSELMSRRTADHLRRPTQDGHAHLSVKDGPSRHSFRMWRHDEGGGGGRTSSPTCGHRHRSHSLHMILAVFSAFVLTYLPFTVINLADQRAPARQSNCSQSALSWRDLTWPTSRAGSTATSIC